MALNAACVDGALVNRRSMDSPIETVNARARPFTRHAPARRSGRREQNQRVRIHRERGLSHRVGQRRAILKPGRGRGRSIRRRQPEMTDQNVSASARHISFCGIKDMGRRRQVARMRLAIMSTSQPWPAGLRARRGQPSIRPTIGKFCTPLKPRRTASSRDDICPRVGRRRHRAPACRRSAALRAPFRRRRCRHTASCRRATAAGHTVAPDCR